MQTTNIKQYLHLHLIVFIWGFTAILGALIKIDAIPLVWYRMTFATLFVFLYFKFKNRSLKVDIRALMKFLLGGVLIALHWIFFFSAIKVSNVSVALVAMSSGALFTSIIEPFFFKRKLIPTELIFGLIVIGGLYTIFNVESQYSLGIIYALIAALLAALFTVLNGLFVRNYDANVISFYQLGFGALFITGYILLYAGFDISDFKIDASDFGYLLLLSSICTAYAFIASVKVMKHLTPFTVMLTINLEPVYAIILALLIFGEKERMSPEFYIGAIIIIFTLILNGIVKNKKK